jgi:hypothetical protein
MREDRQSRRQDKRDERRSKRSEFVCEEVSRAEREEKLWRVLEKKRHEEMKKLQNAKFSDCDTSHLPINSRSPTHATRKLMS